VKSGPASIEHRKFRQISNTASSCSFKTTVASDNFIDRNIHVQGTITMRVLLKGKGAFGTAEDATEINFCPSSFPLNTILNSVIVSYNGSKTQVNSQDVSETI
jgi:hypothetical protein